MADFPNIEPDLEEIALIANNQTYDSILTGEFQSAGLSGAKWQCTPTFSNRNGKEARDLRAFIFNQEGVAGRFNYYPASIDNLGTHAGQGVVDGAGQVGKSLITKGWDADQELLFAAGDYLTVNGEMKMVTADVSVGQDYIEYDAVNYMPSPFDPEGWFHLGDTDGTITNITLENPSGQSFVGLVEMNNSSSYIVNRTENIDKQPAVTGEVFYSSFQYKPLTIQANDRFVCTLFSSAGGAESITFDAFNQNILSTGNEGKIKFTYLNGGFIQVEIYGEANSNESDYGWQFVLTPLASGSNASVYVQAAFFGKADGWPAKLRANATIPITPALRVSPSDENAIEVNNPYFPARLETDDQSRLQVSSPVIYNTSLSIVEDF